MAPCDYSPEVDYPHIPKAAWAQQLHGRSRPAPGGCLLWLGVPDKRGRRVPAAARADVRVCRPDGVRVRAAANRLAWWLYHGTFPGRADALITTCKQPACIAQAHLHLRPGVVIQQDFPHLSDSDLRARLDAHSASGPGGCRLWTGHRHHVSAERHGAGMMRLSVPGGGSVHLFAHKLAWFLVHRDYPKDPHLLAHTCGQVICINPDHLRPYHREANRRLTDAQVAEARALYWPPRGLLNDTQLTMAPPSAVHLAAWALGMSPLTVRAVVEGRRVHPGKWRGYAKSVDHVLRAVALFGPLAQLHQRAHAQLVSVETLARRFGSNMASMHGALHGVTYAHVPMPQEARASVRRQKLDSAQAERDAASRQAHRELERIYRAAEGIPEPTDAPEVPRVISLSQQGQRNDASVFVP